MIFLIISAALFAGVLVWHARLPRPGGAYQRVIMSSIELALAIPAVIAVGLGGYLLFAQRSDASASGMALALALLDFGLIVMAGLRMRWQSRA